VTAIEFNHKILNLSDNLQYFAYSLTSNRDDAKDLIQETYLRAITHKDKFDPSTNLKAWVYTIMKNVFINKYRKAVRLNKIIDYTQDLHYMSNSNHSYPVSADSKYNHSELERMLNDLEEEHRIPFQMHFEGYKYREIADNLNISLGTVKSRIFFCRRKMIEKLKDFQN
jgi:RNA polymerase sigma-70 factor (ECF subfamily)